MYKILSVLILLIGISAGAASGFFYKSLVSAQNLQPESVLNLDQDKANRRLAQNVGSGSLKPMSEFVKLSDQFFIPIVNDHSVQGMMAMSISLEAPLGRNDEIRHLEPKLRDALLQVLFDHANIGGFSGKFTQARNMEILRSNLFDVAKRILGQDIKSVLITDIARQDA